MARLAVLAAALCALLPATANAAFPGPNGKLAFSSGADIVSINPDGSARTNLTTSFGAGEASAAYSADGRRIAYVASGKLGTGTNLGIYVMNFDGTDWRQVVSDFSIPCRINFDVSWSPDGTKLLFSCESVDSEIFIVNLDGTGLQALTNDGTDEYEPVWSPDGTRIAFRRNGIWTMNPDGSGQTQLPTGQGWSPEWSPDSSRIAYTNPNSTCFGCWDLYAVNRDGTNIVPLTVTTPAQETNAAWSPDGTKIAFDSCVEGAGSVCPQQIFAMNADGTGRQLLDSSGANPNWQAVGPPLEQVPDHLGKIAFVTPRDHSTGLSDEAGHEIYVMNPDGTKQRRLTANGLRDAEPAWSPDGTKIAYSSTRSSRREVFVMNADGSGQTNLTNLATADDWDPTWSPDGTRIAFTTNRDEGGFDSAIYVMNADGSGQTRLTFPRPGDPSGQRDRDPAWSPDGNRIAFTGRPGDIFTVSPNGTGLTNVTHDPREYTEVSWSPEGARFAFVIQDTIHPDIWVMNADGSNRTQITNEGPETQGAHAPAWSPDGTRIAASLTADPNSVPSDDVYSMNPQGGDRQNLTNFRLNDSQPSWRPITGYPRPKGATPARFSLVTAYRPCTAPNRQHGPPLAFASCSAPQKTSQHLTVGTGDSNGKPALNEGYVTFGTVVGVPSTPADEADVRLEMFVDDVFTQSLADYAGELRATFTVRSTDRLSPSAGSTPAATTTDIPLGASFGCTPVADPQKGSTCSGTTTIDALIPGAVSESKRSIWQLDQVRVFDGGADGDGDTVGDNTLFATAGVFVP